MLPIRNISYLLPMCCSFWEKCINSQKIGLGCSTPLIKIYILNVLKTKLINWSDVTRNHHTKHFWLCKGFLCKAGIEDFHIIMGATMYYRSLEKIWNMHKAWQGTKVKQLKGVLHPWALFLKTFVHFLKKIKQLRTKYPMDLVRNVPRNSKITVLFQ